MCAPKNSIKIRVPKLTGLQEEINEPTVIAGDFRTFISVTDIVYLNSTTNQLDFVDVCKILNPKTTKYTFFSS